MVVLPLVPLVPLEKLLLVALEVASSLEVVMVVPLSSHQSLEVEVAPSDRLSALFLFLPSSYRVTQSSTRGLF